MRADAYLHAMAEFPREACGLVLEQQGRVRYWPCRNLSTAANCFMLAPGDYAIASEVGEVAAIVHSHPLASEQPSSADRLACEASGLPWHIVSVPLGRWAHLEPHGYTPDLVGRNWVHGVTDCYTLVRDWYRIHCSIWLTDYARRDEWWLKGDDLYLDHFADEGFHEIPTGQIRHGDALLMAAGSRVPNHAAVYVGDNTIIHHVRGRLSGREVLDDAWRRRITHVLRYADNPAAG